MTRKDFEAVANVLAMLPAEAVDAHRGEIERELRATNANFNEIKFWQAIEAGR